jgi:hypothetical protein
VVRSAAEAGCLDGGGRASSISGCGAQNPCQHGAIRVKIAFPYSRTRGLTASMVFTNGRKRSLKEDVISYWRSIMNFQ